MYLSDSSTFAIVVACRISVSMFVLVFFLPALSHFHILRPLSTIHRLLSTILRRHHHHHHFDAYPCLLSCRKKLAAAGSVLLFSILIFKKAYCNSVVYLFGHSDTRTF